jgi:hypothetical protein
MPEPQRHPRSPTMPAWGTAQSPSPGVGPPPSALEQVPGLVRELYATAAKLRALFPGRPFTLDGHLVGSIGEVIAAEWYGLELLPCSVEAHDARAPGGRLVQIKATQRAQIGITAEPEHLIVLRLLPSGEAEEVFNGPGALAWARVGPRQKTSLCHVSVSILRRLMLDVPVSARLP